MDHKSLSTVVYLLQSGSKGCGLKYGDVNFLCPFQQPKLPKSERLKSWTLCLSYGGFYKNVQSLVLKYGVLKSMVRLKMSILQIWVTWASKITSKLNLQLCSIKIKGSHAPCDVTAAALYLYLVPKSTVWHSSFIVRQPHNSDYHNGYHQKT